MLEGLSCTFLGEPGLTKMRMFTFDIALASLQRNNDAEFLSKQYVSGREVGLTDGRYVSCQLRFGASRAPHWLDVDRAPEPGNATGSRSARVDPRQHTRVDTPHNHWSGCRLERDDAGLAGIAAQPVVPQPIGHPDFGSHRRCAGRSSTNVRLCHKTAVVERNWTIEGFDRRTPGPSGSVDGVCGVMGPGSPKPSRNSSLTQRQDRFSWESSILSGGSGMIYAEQET
ncbi:hypothetical protein B0H17DRAFT_1259636 [Mycena rosella]|uniref:Uncharacterized protein n=1 Tax=Mycena rosella TaxID=1033263 RepID=A0AAD7CS11_MYCRO|nr:hypothetical protein B0H17DRAFT_1259636 [Mycena rosella]